MELIQLPSPRLHYSQIEAELKRTLFKPDTQAFQIILAAQAAHYLKPHGYPPMWLMLIGPSGSGKTTMFEFLPDVWHINDLTPKTFLSGFKQKKGSKKSSLLHQLGESAVIVMKDFTTILSMRFENKAEIMAQMREICDGRFCRATGTGDILYWTGRITILACCTPAIDRDRMTFRVMGDRFMELRWAGPPSEELAQCVIGQERSINFEPIKSMVKKYYQMIGEVPKLTPKQVEQIASLANGVAILRTPMIRDEKGYTLLDVGITESPTRISQSLTSIVLSSAALEHAEYVDDCHMDLAIRIAQDSVPPTRRFIMKVVGKNGTCSDDLQLMQLSKWTRNKTIEDLVQLHLLEESEGQYGDSYLHYTSEAERLNYGLFS